MLEFILALTLSFGYPSFNDDGTCSPNYNAPLGDLGTAEVHFMARYSKLDEILVILDARGKQGLTQDVIISETRGGTVWLILTDTTGNRSCASNYVGINLAVDVPPDVTEPHDVWFDITGRHVQAPRVPGIYIHLVGGKALKVYLLQ